MSWIQTAKNWVGGLTEIGLMLIALAIVAGLLVGTGNLAFFGNVTGNIVTLVTDLGKAGLAGLIALGVVLWLFSHRSVS